MTSRRSASASTRWKSRLAYQDDTIETLNQTITAQWKQIDLLTRQLAQLERAAAGGREQCAGPANEPPPHY